MFKDNLFKKVEKKSGVNKETIINLAQKLEKGNMKDKNTLREVIREISSLTGKDVSEEKEEKIINTIINDQVPNIDNII